MLREWTSELPDGIAETTEESLSAEQVVRITPVNTLASYVEFRIGDYGTFGLYLGTSMAFEDLPLSRNYLVEICDAVRAGRIEEQLLTIGRRVVRAKGVLHLASGDLYDTDYQSLLGSLGIGRLHSKSYDPYD